MPITINIQLMSGQVLKYNHCRARNGSVKYLTVAKQICETVLIALSLDPEEYRVKLIHDDDEERVMALHRQRMDSSNLKFGRPEAKEEDYSLDGWHPLDKQRLQDAVDQARVYQDGAVVHAIVNEFNVRRAWDELDDEESESDSDE